MNYKLLLKEDKNYKNFKLKIKNIADYRIIFEYTQIYYEDINLQFLLESINNKYGNYNKKYLKIYKNMFINLYLLSNKILCTDHLFTSENYYNFLFNIIELYNFKFFNYINYNYKNKSNLIFLFKNILCNITSYNYKYYYLPERIRNYLLKYSRKIIVEKPKYFIYFMYESSHYDFLLNKLQILIVIQSYYTIFLVKIILHLKLCKYI